MTIRAGRGWGDTGPVPDDLVRVEDDAALGALIARCRHAQTPIPPVVMQGGDLHRAVGGRPGVDRSRAGGDVARLPCDVLSVSLDGVEAAVAVAHVVVQRPFVGSSRLGWWRGRLVGVMNVQYLGRWDVAPRSHPNDGRADLVEVDAAMTARQRLLARRRLELGAHLPHPAIRIRQTREFDLELRPGEHVVVDGVDLGRASQLHVTVLPDAVTVIV